MCLIEDNDGAPCPPARQALFAKMRRMLGKKHLDAVHLDVVNMLLGPDCWTLLADAMMEAQVLGTKYHE